MNHLRKVSRLLVGIATLSLTVACFAVFGNATHVVSDNGDETVMNIDDSSVYAPEYGVKIVEPFDHTFDIEIVTVESTTETTTTEEETTTTTSTTTTTETETTTTSTATTTTVLTTTKPKTTTAKTTTKATTKTTTSTVATESSSTQSTTVSSNNLPITQAEFYMLANLVAHEYGADWVTLHEKAKVVATVMNRVRMSKFPNTVREVILQKNQYCWVPDSYYWKRTTQSCKDAVTYYFQHTNEFSSKITSFYGDGWVNHFY